MKIKRKRLPHTLLLCNVPTLCLISLYTHPLSSCMKLITQRAYLNIFDFIRFFSLQNTLLCVFNRFFFISPWIKSCDVLPLKVLSKLVKIKQHYNVFWNNMKKVKRSLYKMHNSSSTYTLFLITSWWNWIYPLKR